MKFRFRSDLKIVDRPWMPGWSFDLWARKQDMREVLILRVALSFRSLQMHGIWEVLHINK